MSVPKGLLDYCEDDYTKNMLDDLQLAAELGKTLLERNKDLENALKQHQNIIEDQAQEIEYLTKQTVALREVSDSRLRIYEQLEVSIQDLERANHRLALDNSSGKKHIKSLTATIESLENKCEELQTTIDDLRLQVDVLKRRAQKAPQETTTPTSNHVRLRHVERNSDDEDETTRNNTHTKELPCKISSPEKTEPQKPSTPEKVPQNEEIASEDSNIEQLSQLLAQLRETKTQLSRDQRRITELEEQLSTKIQENRALENQVIQLTHRDDDVKSMYDELSTLEEVRKGQMCSRCLRSVDRSSDDIPDDDDSSMLDELMTSQHRTSFSMDVQEHSGNQSSPASKNTTGSLYKDLVQKYEALLEVQRESTRNQKRAISLQEELQISGDFRVKDIDEESGQGDSLKPEKLTHNKARTSISHTPTDFSEAETSSSGFADETSNKCTQTDDRAGSFLCTIADGDNKFSIYDHTSPIAARFKDKPDYQALFKEIFTVLKNTSVINTELPKIDDLTPIKISHSHSILESTPIEILDDDSRSVVSSAASEFSISQNEPTTVIENIIQSQNQPIPEPEPEIDNSQDSERILRPLVRQPLEFIRVEERKRSSSRRKNKHADRSDSPITHIIGSPKINYTNKPNSGKKKRDFRNLSHENDSTWNGNTVQYWSSAHRNTASPTPSQGSGKFEFRPSLASQELNKLKKLDRSYAEVVRKADSKKQAARQRRK